MPTLPICVDLDGTLLKTDMLYETVLLLVKKNPLYLFLLPFWLLKGKAWLKYQIALRITCDPVHLPYHEEFLKSLKTAHEQNRHLILITASNQKIAETIARHLNIFAEVIGSNAENNLKGRHKAALLSEKFGNKGFIYAGNDHSDLAVWQQAAGAIVVNAPTTLLEKAKAITTILQYFPANKKQQLKAFIRSFRPHQWVKNLLIFIPILVSHQLMDITLLFKTCIAFISFSAAASSAYILNDLIDLSSDRQHHSKRLRPFAAGTLNITTGFILFPTFLLLSLSIAWFVLPPLFLAILIIYYILTLAYSFFLKRKALVDVICLASLYTLRVVAGAAVLTIFAISHWLLAFSIFIFICLAFVKRYSEAYHLRLAKKLHTAGRGYNAHDLEILGTMGINSGYISILIMALYINSPEVRKLYTNPDILWFVCLLLLYWISRVWLLAHRGQMHDDPIVFALRDTISYLVIFLISIIVLLAI